MKIASNMVGMRENNHLITSHTAFNNSVNDIAVHLLSVVFWYSPKLSPMLAKVSGTTPCG